MYATLKFDVEDVYYPPEYRIDDVCGWLSEIMTDHGIRGTLCVLGEKARCLKDRGRNDILKAMGRHDLVSHQLANLHPVIPEILEDKGWDDGVAAMAEYEDKVTEDFQYAFGRDPVGLSRHDSYFGAQHVALAGMRGLGYMTSYLGSPGYETPNWYAGTLNMPGTETARIGGFDQIYTCDDAFEQQLRKLDEYIAGCRDRGVEYVSIFGCHPVMVMARGWIERRCLASGATKTPQEIGWLFAVKTPEEEARGKANFARLATYLTEHPDIEMIGFEEAVKLFSTQVEDINRDELTQYALTLMHSSSIALHRTFSPAELVCGLAESIVHAERQGDLPFAARRRDVLGPKVMPPSGAEVDIITNDELVAMCGQLIESVTESGHLPPYVTVSSGRVTPGQFAMTAARAYTALAGYDKYEKLSVPEARGGRYPNVAGDVDVRVRRTIGEHWGMADGFSCEKIAEHCRLQTWTIKPAWLSPPRAHPRGGARMII